MIGLIILLTIGTTIVVMIIARQSRKRLTVYTINKGKHYSKSTSSLFLFPWKIALTRPTVRFMFMFTDGCEYDDHLVGGQVNKLYGVSYGFDHHYRSVRIGWGYSSNLKVIQLFSYTYNKGKRHIDFLCSVKPFTENYALISHSEGKPVIIEIKDQEGQVLVVSGVQQIQNSPIRFKLFPYFGGRQPAPNDVKIIIKEL